MKNILLRIGFRIFNFISFVFAAFAVLEVFSTFFCLFFSLTDRDLRTGDIMPAMVFSSGFFFLLSWFPYIIARKLWLMIDDGKKKPKWTSIMLRKNTYEIWTSMYSGPIVRFLQLGSYTGPKTGKTVKTVKSPQNSVVKEENPSTLKEAVYDDVSAYEVDTTGINIEADSAYVSSAESNESGAADAIIQNEKESVPDNLSHTSLHNEKIRVENIEYEEMLIALDTAADNLEPYAEAIETEAGQRKLVEMAGIVFDFILEVDCSDLSDSYYLKLGEAFINNKKNTNDNLNPYLADADRWDLLGAYKALCYFKKRCCSYEEEIVEEYKNATVQELLYRMQLMDEEGAKE